MDGASTQQVLLRVMLPVVRPGLITVAIISGLNAWNEFLISSTFLQGNYTATLGYLSMNGTFSTNEGVMMAGGGPLSPVRPGCRVLRRPAALRGRRPRLRSGQGMTATAGLTSIRPHPRRG